MTDKELRRCLEDAARRAAEEDNQWDSRWDSLAAGDLTEQELQSLTEGSGIPDDQGRAALYSSWILAVYDLFVLGFSNSLVWRCPSRLILDLYDENMSADHLDIGVGTGYFLHRCRYPVPDPRITLLDLNPNCLKKAARRLRRYGPATLMHDVLEPFPADLPRFDSIGLSYLLHCLPGDLRYKGAVFSHLREHLTRGGRVFGATILGRGTPKNWLAARLMRTYNASGVFSNTEDSLADLQQILSEQFTTSSVRRIDTGMHSQVAVPARDATSHRSCYPEYGIRRLWRISSKKSSLEKGSDL